MAPLLFVKGRLCVQAAQVFGFKGRGASRFNRECGKNGEPTTIVERGSGFSKGGGGRRGEGSWLPVSGGLSLGFFFRKRGRLCVRGFRLGFFFFFFLPPCHPPGQFIFLPE